MNALVVFAHDLNCSPYRAFRCLVKDGMNAKTNAAARATGMTKDHRFLVMMAQAVTHSVSPK
jgi:hypothetical protein